MASGGQRAASAPWIPFPPERRDVQGRRSHGVHSVEKQSLNSGNYSVQCCAILADAHLPSEEMVLERTNMQYVIDDQACA